jgi:hypothetical protein
MAIHPSTQRSERPSTREAQVLKRLVSARVFGPHAFFFVSGEDEFFPNGVEESSGFVLDRNGQVWSFWTGWDADRGEVTLDGWEMTDPEPEWREDEEYQRARAAVGLPAKP